MARACGLRLGSRRFEIVVLDGSPKKPKIVECFSDDLPPLGEEYDQLRADILKKALKRAGKGTENLGVAIDTSYGAFRQQNLPITDTSKIESVLKYEVESQLPQYNIDDVVIDWELMSSTSDSSTLLITAVPKEAIERTIGICSRAGAEPIEVELETSAMVEAAFNQGLGSPDSAQIFVHVGDTSTGVAVVDGGEVRELRAIHMGALVIEAGAGDEPAEAPDEGLSAYEEGEPEAAESEGEPSFQPARVVTGRQLEEILQRIRRELSRTVTAAPTKNEIEVIYVCGVELPGLAGSELMGVPVEDLPGFEVEDDQALSRGSCSAAFGAALHRLGSGALKPHLRREELQYAGTWERLEFPLAVMLLLLVTFLGVQQILLTKEINSVNKAIVIWRESSNSYMMGKPKENISGHLRYPPEKIIKYVSRTCGKDTDGKFREDPNLSRVQQLRYIKETLRKEVKAIENDLGMGANLDVPQPLSALKGLTLVLSVFDEGKKEGWRPSLRLLKSTYERGSRNKPDRVRVTLDLSFLADSSSQATAHYEAFIRALDGKPWFRKFDRKQSDAFETGISLQGIVIELDPSKAEVN